MHTLAAGDPLAPVTAIHVIGVKEMTGVVFRMDFITRNNQPLDQADNTPNYVLKPALARALAKQLVEAADTAEGLSFDVPPAAGPAAAND